MFFIQQFFWKKKIFCKITPKNNFWQHDQFLGNGVSDNKNEYNIFYGKWGTKYDFEIFSSKTPIPAERTPKNQFWGRIFRHISGYIGPISDG